MLLGPAHRLLDVLRGLAIHDRLRVRAVEAAVDQQPVMRVRRARGRDDRPLDLARELAERPTDGLEPEAGERADSARA
jgi:hypothetical protein